MSKNKREIFSELRDCVYIDDIYNRINEVKISSLTNNQIIDELKNLKVIELKTKLEEFSSYINYDHYLIFKLNDDYYFCDTELVQSLDIYSMVKMIDYHLYLRKDKIKKIESSPL